MNKASPEKTAIIVGAGFSKALGGVAYDDVKKKIAGKSKLDSGSCSEAINKCVHDFLRDVFDCNPKKYNELPSLEQVFTLIDISANSGCYLGGQYPPAKLRAMRRFLIYKLFSIIDTKCNRKKFNLVDKLLDNYPESNFISLNWDIVLELALYNRNSKSALYTSEKDFCYGVGEEEVNIIGCELDRINGNSKDDEKVAKIAKVHGSANWAYCDNCHKVFYERFEKMTHLLRANISENDFRLFDISGPWLSELKPYKCPVCGQVLGSHIATFSFNKSFRTHAFGASWKTAEDILADAERWIFIGYSLPDADYVFAHTLKCAQKMKDREIEIIVVVKNGTNNADNANECSEEKRYERLFGKNKITFYKNGFKDFVKGLQD